APGGPRGSGGDPPAAVVEAALQAAPEGAEVTVGRTGDLVQVEVRARTPGLGKLTIGLHARAVALAEETVGTGTPVDGPPTEEAQAGGDTGGNEEPTRGGTGEGPE
ncbi:TadE family type IV pilus minor pilin, partial [Streptomyces sp. S5]|uniref:TadE family type IV pilus minor pilin n=1 Tax=Streptomyces sp. S5 TaxID=1456735 RepID=UPI000EF86EDA